MMQYKDNNNIMAIRIKCFETNQFIYNKHAKIQIGIMISRHLLKQKCKKKEVEYNQINFDEPGNLLSGNSA